MYEKLKDLKDFVALPRTLDLDILYMSLRRQFGYARAEIDFLEDKVSRFEARILELESENRKLKKAIKDGKVEHGLSDTQGCGMDTNMGGRDSGS